MPKLPPNDNELCILDNSIDENEAEEIEEISEQLYQMLQANPNRFNRWETDFIIDILYLDEFGLTDKQIEQLYRLDKKYLRD